MSLARARGCAMRASPDKNSETFSVIVTSRVSRRLDIFKI